MVGICLAGKRLETNPLDLKQILANDLVKEELENMDESVAALPQNKYINDNDIVSVYHISHIVSNSINI